jgi:peptide/nickel transport system permease protein
MILVVAAVFGSNIWNVMWIMGLTGWPGLTRLVRAEFLAFKNMDFVLAAEGSGATDFHIIFREILPNAIFPAIVSASMRVSGAIMTESSLSFLGLGDPNAVSWGWILNESMRAFRIAWWLSLFPGFCITFLAIGFNLLGDGLNDALNPHLKER